LQFRFDEHTGRLTPNAPARVEPEAVLGPRHFCFHPSLDILYFSNEQGCSVTGYRLDTATGTLSAFQTITTLPEGYTERNTCSQIQITASGRFLYAPNRGHNSIACFAVDPTTGQLTATGRVASEPIPNAFSLDPQDQFLFSAGQASGRMASFRINAESGVLPNYQDSACRVEPVNVMGLAWKDCRTCAPESEEARRHRPGVVGYRRGRLHHESGVWPRVI